MSTITVDTLAPMWRRAVDVTEAGEWTLPDFVAAVVIHGERHRYVRESTHSRELDRAVCAYRVLHDDSTVGPRVERPVTVTRRWSEKPPNDGTRIAMLWSDGLSGRHRGQFAQKPSRSQIAWTTMPEWIASLSAPRVVELTEDDANIIARRINEGTHPRLVANDCNASLRLRQRGERGA